MTTDNTRLFKPFVPAHPPGDFTVTPRPSCEPEIRAIGDRLRHLVATDSDAPRHIEEQLGDLLPVVPRLRLEIEDLKADIARANRNTDEAEDTAKESEKRVEGWDALYLDAPDLPTTEEMANPEEVEAFMEAYATWSDRAAKHYNSY